MSLSKFKQKFFNRKDINHPISSLFASLPYKRVVNDQSSDEVFDLYHLGNFTVDNSFLSSLTTHNSCVINENLELVKLNPHTIYKPHFHKKSAAVIYIIAGNGKFYLDDQEINYHPEKRIIIPSGIVHGFKTHDVTLFLSIQSPPIIDFETNEVDLYYKGAKNEQIKYNNPT